VLLDLLLHAAEGGAGAAGGYAVKLALDRVKPALLAVRKQFVAFNIGIRKTDAKMVRYLSPVSEMVDWTEVLDRIPTDYGARRVDTEGAEEQVRHWYTREGWSEWHGPDGQRV
jgi:hypothetical protein